ncbi:MFS transporter [Pseudomonas capsici]|uniref:hypothetical protein n=1 Tax=Pseudomonas capsici TaxID=2810614 RepID=UPI0021F1AE81|nr:hypothetical protein [Pseudomonas capsici]MCV4342575.1 hypothetical protein [Pseudomonas capsici]
MSTLKKHMIILLCFGISLTERFTQASIPLLVDHLGLTSFEMSLFLSAMAASTVFTSVVIAPYIDTYNRISFLGLMSFLGVIAGLSFFMFNYNKALGWGCFLMFCIGATLRIINLRRLSVINSETVSSKLSRTHTRMQLSITVAMAIAPLCLTLIAPRNYLNFTIVMLLICIFFSGCTSSSSPLIYTTQKSALVERTESREQHFANSFIFIGMLLSGLFLSALLLYCKRISDHPEQLYAHIVLSQMIGLILANIMFERFFGGRFKRYGILITIIALSELAFIFLESSFFIKTLSCLIGFSFQVMFLRSHNQFQRTIPHGLSAKLNGIRGLYTFAGITAGYLLGPFLYNAGGIELVFLCCSATALLFFFCLKHLTPSH